MDEPLHDDSGLLPLSFFEIVLFCQSRTPGCEFAYTTSCATTPAPELTLLDSLYIPSQKRPPSLLIISAPVNYCSGPQPFALTSARSDEPAFSRSCEHLRHAAARPLGSSNGCEEVCVCVCVLSVWVCVL